MTDMNFEASIDQNLKTGKYILTSIEARLNDGVPQKTFVLVAKPYPNYSYHSDIARWYRSTAQPAGMSIMGGGIMEVSEADKHVHVFGTSGSYGDADPEIVRRILERQYQGYTLKVEPTGEIW